MKSIDELSLMARGNRLLIPLLLVLIATAAFHNTLLNSFSYDDNVIIVHNQQNLGSLENMMALVTKDYFSISKEATYRPMVTFSYFMDQYIWGLNPFGFHLTNFFIHLVNSLLVLSLFKRLCGNDFIAVASAALYSVQPVLTEAINSVGFREDLLASMLVLLSMLLYLKGRLQMSILSYGMALLSKESAFPLPLLIIAYDYLYDRGIIFKRYLWYSIIAVLYLYIRFFLLYNPVEETLSNKVPLLLRLASIPVVIFYYIKLLLFPIPLVADYPSFDFLLMPSLSSYLMPVTGILIWLATRRFLNKAAIFGICWFMVTLLPVLNIVPIIYPFAERFLYLPAIGFMLFIGNLQMNGRFLNVRAVLILFTVISFFALSYNRNTIWKSEESLWKDTISKSPHSLRASLNMSALLFNKKEYDSAIEVLKRYLELAPEYHGVFNSMGNAYAGKKDYANAIENYEKAISLKPGEIAYRGRLSVIYEIQGDLKRSLEECKKALEIDPYNPDLLQRIGNIYAAQGLFEESAKAFEKALSINPLFPDAHYSLGVLYERKGMNIKAFQEYRDELAINHLYSAARIAIGNLFAKSGRYKEAKREFLAVLNEEPENEEARLSLHKLREIKAKDAN